MTVADGGFRTSAWNGSDTILFAPAASSVLFRVPATGGDAVAVTTLDAASGEAQHSYPAFLPDGRHFLYASVGTMTGALAPRGVYIASLDRDQPATLLLPQATQAFYASGHLLFLRNSKLMAQSFDPERRELRGAPIALVEQVDISTTGATGVTASFSVSDNGVLIYQVDPGHVSQPVWFDRNGTRIGALGEPGDYGDVALSPDGTSLAVSVLDPALATKDIWLYDVRNGGRKKLTFDAEDEFAPVWSPDGRRMLFSSLGQGGVNLYTRNVDGLGERQSMQVDSLGIGRFAADWSRDYLMYIGGGRVISRSDLWVAPTGSPQRARPLLESMFVETHGRIAPNATWFAYASNETGRLEVYVDRFPARGAARPVSRDGGGWPRWAKDRSEIFYLSEDDQLMAAAVRVNGERLDVDPPRVLFRLRPRPPVRLDAYAYDVSRDGQRFVVNTLIEEAASTVISVVLDWDSALRSE
jgi:dipeptidyl aminopeptidase/acylaminoacyl peptidase